MHDLRRQTASPTTTEEQPDPNSSSNMTDKMDQSPQVSTELVDDQVQNNKPSNKDTKEETQKKTEQAPKTPPSITRKLRTPKLRKLYTQRITKQKKTPTEEQPPTDDIEEESLKNPTQLRKNMDILDKITVLVDSLILAPSKLKHNQMIRKKIIGTVRILSNKMILASTLDTEQQTEIRILQKDRENLYKNQATKTPEPNIKKMKDASSQTSKTSKKSTATQASQKDTSKIQQHNTQEKQPNITPPEKSQNPPGQAYANIVALNEAQTNKERNTSTPIQTKENEESDSSYITIDEEIYEHNHNSRPLNIVQLHPRAETSLQNLKREITSIPCPEVCNPANIVTTQSCIEIHLPNEEATVKALQTFRKHKKLDSMAYIKEKTPKLNKVIILGVPTTVYEEHLNSILQYSLKDKAYSIQDCKPARNGNNWIITSSQQTKQRLLNLRYITAGFKNCAIKPYILLNRCKNCQSFCHPTFKCPNSTRCGKCGDLHHDANCKSQIYYCINCEDDNKEFKTEYNCYHPAYSYICPSYQAIKAHRLARLN